MDTEKYLRSAGCKSTLIPFLQPHFEECFEKYDINTPCRIAAFLSQLAHESGTFFYTQEIASGSAYEGRKDLGNTQSGDGVKFKGRGFIQITGRANYTSLSKALGVDFVNNPNLLGGKTINVCTAEQMRNATLSAGWFWGRTGLNSLADKLDLRFRAIHEPNLSNFKKITKKINGGYNGLEDRQNRFDKIRVAFT